MTKTLLTLVLILTLFREISSAQWIYNNGPYGGWVTDMAADSAGRLYATSGNYLLKTDNIINGWETIRSSAEKHDLVLMTREGVLIVAMETGAIRSSDGGVNWQDASNGLPGEITSMIQMESGRIVSISYTANGYFLCTTDDLGLSWNAVPHEESIHSGLEKDPITGNLYYISGLHYAGTHKVSSSADGITWQTTDLPGYFDVLDFMVDDQGRLYILYSENNYCGLRRSADHGLNFTEILYLAEFYPFGVAQIDNGDLLVTFYQHYFKRSTDDGITWQDDTGADNMDIVHTFDIPGDTVFCQANNGIYFSTDNGYTWLWGSDGIFPKILASMAVSDSGVIIASTERTKLWRSDDDGLSWQDITYQVPSFEECFKLFYTGSHFWIYYGTGQLYQFARYDGNGQWDVLNNPGVPLAFSSTPGGDTYLGTYDLYKSEDFGESWNEITSLLRPDLLMSGVKCLNSGTVLVIGNVTDYQYYIYRSTDNGNIWSLVYEPSILNYYPTLAMTFHCDGIGNIYIGNAPYFYHSNDDGLTWNPVDFPDSLNITALYTDAANGLYVTSDDVLYKSIDNGNSWEVYMDGLPAYGDSFDLTESGGNNIYLRMRNNGIYKSDITVSSAGLQVPETEFNVYPNPADNTLIVVNPSSNPEINLVLHLFDISGKCLKEIIVSGNKATIDLTNLPAGTYLLKGDIGVRKVVVIK